MAEITTCTECGHSEDASTFCTACGARLPQKVMSVEVPMAVPVDNALITSVRTSDAAARPSGWQTAGKVVDGVATGATILVGIVWLIIGVALLGFAFAKPSILFLFGPLCILYAIYLFKPGGWKLVIY